MPELPEVESIRRHLAPSILGKTIQSVEVMVAKQFIGKIDDVVGKEITELGRNGKVMWWRLKDANDEVFLNFHLKMSGQVLLEATKYTRIIFTFTDKSKLYFNDLRKFGWIKITKTPETQIGPDVLTKEFTLAHFAKSLATTARDIKTVLLDQDRFAGIGNIYANDALWEAKIDPRRPASSLSAAETKLLYEKVKLVIDEGVKYEGSSASEVYRMPDGAKGSYQDHFRVYKQHGSACKRCGELIMRVKHNGRSSYFCPKCQT